MEIQHQLKMPADQAGRRLDQAMAELLPDYSRSRLKGWIDSGCVKVDGQVRAPKYRLSGGELVEVCARLDDPGTVAAQDIPLEILFQDDSVLVIDKPAGLVVHPGAGNRDRTMQNALLHLDPRLATLPRSGIVHRLDKDTSGLLVVARTSRAHKTLVAALEARDVERRYLALVRGQVTAGGTVSAPIGRHPVQRTRMSVRNGGRPATTHFRVRERFRGFTLLDIKLETGRTHQIRVHLAHAGFPLVGDPVYGGRLALPAACGPELADALRVFRRQALHAWRLSFQHPGTGVKLALEAPLPEDFSRLLKLLREDAAGVSASGPQHDR